MTELGSARWPEVDAADRRLLVVPVGSCEQHGPHLPLDTDTRIASSVARRACDGLPGVGLAPAIPIGASGEHADFAGTLSIGTSALTSVLVELGRHASVFWPAMLLVNGHGGNVPALRSAVSLLRSEGRECHAWNAALPAAVLAEAAPGGFPPGAPADPHAGRYETSLMLAIAPSSVLASAAEPGDTRPLASLMPALTEHGVRAVSPNGVLGDPSGASAAEGSRLLNALVTRLRDQIQPLLAT